jgi:parallel beta-helix repeat protein
MSITTSTGNKVVKKSTIPFSNGKTLYVGGSGEGNYTSIKDAVNNASEGDTVFVYSGVYFGLVEIEKPLKLIGENIDTTKIDANNYRNAIKIASNNVIVSGFTVQNSGGSLYDAGAIRIGKGFNSYKNCSIVGNKIVNNFIGIFFVFADYNKISENIFLNNSHSAIFFHGSYCEHNSITSNIFQENTVGFKSGDQKYNDIINNTFINNKYGIKITSQGNLITRNIFTNNTYGLYFGGGGTSNIYKNSFVKNQYGLYLDDSGNNDIKENNFIENECHAYFEVAYYWPLLLYPILRERFKRNYWDNHHLSIPKLIRGKLLRDFEMLNILFALKGINIYLDTLKISWFYTDWHPVKEPYDINIVNIKEDITYAE